MRSAIVLVMSACWRDAPPPQPVAAAAATPPAALAGSYRCAIRDHGYRYPPFPCAIRDIGHHLVLAKQGGSVRFEGEVHPRGDGFTFRGELFCPKGDCNEQVAGTFHRGANGALRGVLGANELEVEMFRVDDSGYGGAAYGGAMYGGSSYGTPSTEIE